MVLPSILLLILVFVASGQDVKICPPEPTLPPGEPCPEVCNRGCDNGICQVYNPFQNIVLPDTMPSLVTCEGIFPNNGTYNCWNTIKCSPNASCDILVVEGAGLFLGVDCGDTTHSCNVYCEENIQINDIRCNNATSCNCQQSNCVLVNSKCVHGLSCIGDYCYKNVDKGCITGVNDKSMALEPSTTGGPCNCSCTDPTRTKFTLGKNYLCLNPQGICSQDSECNYPQGRCENDCKCFNPWGGPRCATHMCPQCENNAFCSNDPVNPCVCTGLWTGQNCTVRLQTLYSRPDIPEHMTRCNTTDIVPWVASPATISSPPDCPSPCSQCSVDADGTPVCLIILPLPDTVVFTAICPPTHRCIGHCAYNCPGYFRCSGNYPCDLVCSDLDCMAVTTCNSSSSCRSHCSSVQKNHGQLTWPVDFSCTHANGSCICDTGDCAVRPCEPGISCNGDPCAAVICSEMKQVAYNNVTKECSCKCYPSLFELPNGVCSGLNTTSDCSVACQNGGLCKDQSCWCPPGYSGVDCSQRDSCVTINQAATCPASCTWCNSGVCFMSLSPPTSSAVIHAICPVGFPCVFICEAGDCRPFANRVVCPAGSGPCELWCWDSFLLPLDFKSELGEFRRRSGCTQISLVCEDGSIGCRSRCADQGFSPNNIYYGARTVREIRCGSMNVTGPSVDPLDRCSSCGTDSCFIGESDPCYQQTQFSTIFSRFGYLPICPTDYLGNYLVPSANSSNQCECVCPSEKQLVNGTCVALGCSPPCKNMGICEIALDLPGTENDTFRCRCFYGWNGVDCSSRCFFPVTANVTACQNGLYRISGELLIPLNQNLSLYGDVPDLIKLEVEGSIKFGGSNSTLSISPPSNWTSNADPSVIVSGNWTQFNGSVLQNTVMLDPIKGTFLTTVVNASGTASFGGTLDLQVSAKDIINWIKAHGGENVSINLFNYGHLGSSFDTVSVHDAGGAGADCEKLVSAPTYSSSSSTGSSSPSGRMDMLFSLDRSNCVAAPSTEGMSINTDIAVGVAVSVVVVIIGVTAGGFFWKQHQEKLAKATIVKKLDDSHIVLQPTKPSSVRPAPAATASSSPGPAVEYNWVRATPQET